MKQKYSPIEEIEIQLTLADKISRLVIHSSSAQEVARKTVVHLGQLVPIDWAALALMDKPTHKALLLHLTGDTSPAEEYTVALADTPFAWVVERKQALLEADLTQESLFPSFASAEGIRTLVHMPLFYQGEVFGVLSAGSYRPNAYKDSQLRFLRHAVAHLAISLKSSLLLEQNLETETTLTNLNELLGIITSSPELPDIFPQFARRLREVIHFDRLALAHIQGNVLRILALFSERDSHPNVGEAYLVSDSAIPWMLEHKELSVAEDFSVSRRFPVDELHFKEGFRGEIRVPLFSHGELFASLHLVSLEPYRLKGEANFLDQLAHYVATPVESYVLYTYEKQRLDWLAALAHHLRTPLTPIVTSSTLMGGEIERLPEQEGRRVLAKLAQNISAGAQDLNRNLELFWELSEVESAGFTLKLEATDAGPVLKQAIDEALPMAEAKSQSFVLDVPQTLPQVSADPARASQILRILLDSCIKASPEGSQIRLQARVVEKNLLIEVIDASAGFSPEERDQLLQPYRLSQADRRSFPELTLKLAIARRLVDSHGGSLWLDSDAGKGNVFSFTLPTAGR